MKGKLTIENGKLRMEKEKLPTGWEVKKLGEILHKTETINPMQNPNKEFVYIDVSSVNNETFSIESTTLLKGKNAPSRARKLIRTNDVIFATVRPTLRRICIIPEEYDNQVCSTGYFVLRMKEQINHKYVFYYLLTDGFNKKMESLQKGASYPAVTDGDVREQIIVYPKTLPEQHHIVGILDQVFAAIATAKANAEKNLANARELFASYLQGADGKKESLGTLVDIRTGKLDANAATETGKYPFFTCSREIFTIDKFAFDCEAILLAGNNAVGDFNVKHYKGKFNAYQRTYVITVNKENRVLYRYLYFQMLKSLKEFKSKSVGVGTKFLKLGMIQDLQIALPSVREQAAIVAKLDALSDETKKLEVIYQQKIADLEELKKSVLQKAYAGELTKV